MSFGRHGDFFTAGTGVKSGADGACDWALGESDLKASLSPAARASDGNSGPKEQAGRCVTWR